MDANTFCDSMYSELTAFRSRLSGIIQGGEKMTGSEQEQLKQWLSRMNSMVDDLNGKIDNLKRECPADWSQHREEAQAARFKVNEEIERWDAEHAQDVHIGS